MCKKRGLPVNGRPFSLKNFTINDQKGTEKESKKIRRSIRKKKQEETINIIYSNIQGYTKKKESLSYIMEELDCDLCLLAETMTRNIKLKGCRCITPNKSVGQNVCIIVRNKLVDNDIIKMYEPNDNVNLIGIRVELMGNSIRIYTAHLKQQSVASRDEITVQFEEIRKQFKDATRSNEPMMLIFDANAHLGGDDIHGCDDDQDWGGQVLRKMIEDENLVLLNSLSLCEGVVTRIDPRNGKRSTIDFAVCNQHFAAKVVEMKIDEDEKFKPTNYASVAKRTDHNTIIVKAKIERSPKKKSIPYLYTKDAEGRRMFREYIEESDLPRYLENSPIRDVEFEFKAMQEFWSGAVSSSFKKITPRSKNYPGITESVRVLMREERWVRDNVLMNPERGRKIAAVRKKIRVEIERNRADEVLSKVATITEAKNPQGEIFKIRRSRKMAEKVGFPLQDSDGTVMVSKAGIDDVVVNHFNKVFMQNPVSNDKIWKDYWNIVDDVFNLLKTKKEQVDVFAFPTFEEVKKIILSTDDKKSVLGTMTSDLIKIGGDNVIGLIHRIIVSCCMKNDIAEDMRSEKLVLIYKNKGQLIDLDNYRGIFIRLLCLSVLQKWLYQKCSPMVEMRGSEYAFGGRIERSVSEVLLIVRLVQDYSHWKKEPLILKFLDVTKFFDTMNYRKCLIEAYESGISGKYWKLYAAINERKKCSPITPLGACPDINIEEVFLQGSCDAMIMAWNLVDSINKTEDVYDPVVVIDGIEIPRTLFVDDILEIIKSFMDLNTTIVGNETFERSNRIHFKPSKCKVMCSNCVPPDDVRMNETILEVVNDHEYLGSIVSNKGRKNDLKKRIADCKGVLNEIVEIFRTAGVKEVCLRFMSTLVEACFKRKFKHGCEVWDDFNKIELKTINNMIPNMIKRVLQIPSSAPTAAIKHDLGVIDMDLEVAMERILLTSKVLQMSNSRISKKLLTSMLEKEIPGFCMSLRGSLNLLGLSSISEIDNESDKRKHLKKLIVNIQRTRVIEEMLMLSKTDRMLMNANYDGQLKGYLLKLPFEEARIIFLWRCRMFPTKCNYPDR